MRFSQVYRLTVKQIRHETHELVLFYKLRYGIGSNWFVVDEAIANNLISPYKNSQQDYECFATITF